MYPYRAYINSVDYKVPYKSLKVEALSTLSCRIVANQVAHYPGLTQNLSGHMKSVIALLLGKENLLTRPVLRALAHSDLKSVNQRKLTEPTLSILKGFPKLESLKIPNHLISSKGLCELFPFLPLLEVVDLSASDQVTDQVLLVLTQSCPNLRYVTLVKCEKFTNQGIMYLANNLPHLDALDLSYTKVTDEGLKILSEGPCSNTLRILRTEGCSVLTAQSTEYVDSFDKNNAKFLPPLI